YIDNVLGQFKGSLAVLHRDTLTEAAADFVTDHDADYPNLDVTSAGDDIIFTSKTAGNDFTGNTTITNTDGDLAGDVDYTQENVVAQAQIDTITVLGTDGTANVTCDTWTKLATWNGTIAQTLQDFVDAWEAFYTTKGISLTNTATELIFEANTPGDPLTPLTSIVTVSGNLRGTVVVTQANIVGQKRIDTITLTGTSGTANILCDAVTKEVDIDEVITNSATWSTRAVGGESLPLLELIGDEIANQTSRTRDLIQMPIIETTEALQMNYIGCFVDDLNQYSGVDRAFVMSRGSFNVKYRLWTIDLMEILPTMAESGYTVDTTVITVDNTLITVDQI
ncbi:MAG TPA: hypothetical protein VMV77_04830, partial [Bacteroidales bacterium]|nr:hypothetical protein [Bacteroidales bacterium]